MTYKERLIAKRMVDLKELAKEYSVKINEKGSKAVAVDKVLKRIDEVLHQEFTDKEIEKIKADLDNGVVLKTALEKARAGIVIRVENNPNEFEAAPPTELTPAEQPMADPNEANEVVESVRSVKKRPLPKKGAQLEFNGKSQNICAWAKELGISANTLYGRIYRMGWSIERAFTTPGRS